MFHEMLACSVFWMYQLFLGSQLVLVGIMSPLQVFMTSHSHADTHRKCLCDHHMGNILLVDTKSCIFIFLAVLM